MYFKWGICMKKTKHFSITMESDILEKFKYISEYNARSASRHILYLVLKEIRDFEKEHGEIEPPLSEDGRGG